MANKLHKDLVGDEVHLPKDFDTAPVETALIKNSAGELEYRALNVLGEIGPIGPQGPDATAIQNVVVVQKAPGPGQYSDPIVAMAAISGSSASNPFVLKIGPGIYQLSGPLVSKEGVTIKPDGHGTVILEPLNPNNDILQITHQSFRVQGVMLRNATGPSAAAMRVSGVASPAVEDFVTIVNCTEGVVVESSTALVQAVLRNIRIISGATTKTLIRATAGGGFGAIIRVYSAILTDDNGTAFEDAVFLTGTGSRIDANTMLIRSTVGVGNGIRLADGAELVSQSGSEVEGFDINLYAQNVGAAPIIRTTTCMLRQGGTWDFFGEHPGVKGSALIKANVETGVMVDDSAPLKLFITDPDPTHEAGIFIRGDILQADVFSHRVNGSKLGRAAATMGRFSGGELSDGGGLNVDITAGSGFLVDPVGGYVKEVTWGAATLTIAAESSAYIFVNTNGIVSQSANVPDLAQTVLLGRVSTIDLSVHFIQRTPMNIAQFGNEVATFQREAFGSVFSHGSIVSENPVTDRALDISSGDYWFGVNNFAPSGGTAVQFSQFYRKAVSGYNIVTGQNQVNNVNYDDGSGVLAALAAGKFAAHPLYLIGDGLDEQYFLQIGQTQFDTQVAAEAADIPMPPSSFDDAVVLIAIVIVQQGQTNIISILDARPAIGFKARGVSASADHGNLLGLLGDDHPQYLLASGARALSGDLNMGGNNVSNVGTVDGVDVSDHRTRHLPNGSDPLTTGTPLETTDSTNVLGTTNDFARGGHAHAHGNRGGGSLHAVATTSAAGFQSAADKVIQDRMRSGFLQYQNSTLFTTPDATFVDAVLDTDLSSFPNSLFTKVSTTEFRADFAGRVELRYSVNGAAAGNNRGFNVQVLKNGSLVTGTARAASSSSTTSKGYCGHTQVVEVANGDLLKLQVASSAAGQVTTYGIGEVSLLVKIYTLGLT